MNLCLLNGDLVPLSEARISPMDRGFLFGDGVYEVMTVVDGRIRAGSLHRDRLASSLAMIELAVDADAVMADVQRLLEAAGHANAKIYVQVSRGPAEVREHRFPSTACPTVFATLSPFTPTQLAPTRALVREDIRWSRNAIKSVSLLANVLLQEEAQRQGAGEVILHRAGVVTEASTSNVFLLSNETLSTPPLSPQILPGITRHLVLEMAEALGFEVRETEVLVSQLTEAETLFVTSSTRGLLPITSVDPGGLVGQGQLSPGFERLSERYNQRLYEHR